MNITRIVNGKWKQNCYLLSDENLNAIVIDPGEGQEVIEFLLEKNLNVIAILCTHAHYDHIASASIIIEKYKAKFYLHNLDQKLLTQANFYKTIFSGIHNIEIPKEVIDLSGGSVLKFKDITVNIFHAPGHTEGGVYLLVENYIFTGDNIIDSKIGRSDLPGGDPKKLLNSIKLLQQFDDEIILMPGHGHQANLKAVKEKLQINLL